MSQIPDANPGSKKRNLTQIAIPDLAGRLRSKEDFYHYLDKQRTYFIQVSDLTM